MHTDSTTDTRWLTYDELAAALAITPDSARRLVARKKWPRRAGNDGKARIGVPAERIPDKPPVIPPDTIPDVEEDDRPDDRGDVTLIVSVLTQHIERIEKELETVKSERDAERLLSAKLALQAAEVDALKSVIDAERKRIDDIKTERDRWAEQAEKLLEQREQLAAAERRGWFGWLKRA